MENILNIYELYYLIFTGFGAIDISTAYPGNHNFIAVPAANAFADAATLRGYLVIENPGLRAWKQCTQTGARSLKVCFIVWRGRKDVKGRPGAVCTAKGRIALQTGVKTARYMNFITENSQKSAILSTGAIDISVKFL